ncbi:hypothetical protein HYALB_00007887 [Hymenoscyphus albidus]|uniref:Restriction of telomere capping protein 4 n=1 Tax=Hymenoscyphus albidus TaxID=595503 RepID=A0A9N9LNR0_9HELO|nr:hypothetical protein HYALB_00007887 [Hymenoscyphus albidus]
MDMKVKLDFINTQHLSRRVGLSKPTRKTPVKSSPIPQTSKDMPPKSSKAPPPPATNRETSDEDISRPPEESSEANDTDDDEIARRTTIATTVLKKGTRGKETQKTVNAGRTGAQKITNGVPEKNCFGIVTGRQQSAHSSQQSSRAGSPAKRKNQETDSGKTDMFGALARKKPKKKQSSKSTSMYGKTARSSGVTSSAKSKASIDDSPKMKFKRPDDIPDSDSPEFSDKENGANDSDNLRSSLKTGKKFKILDEIPSSPVKNDESPKVSFKKPDDSFLNDELGESSPDPSPVKRPSNVKLNRRKGKLSNVEPPWTQMPVFNAMNDIGDLGLDDSALDELAGHARVFLSDDDFDLPVFKKAESDNEDSPSASQPRCPFCRHIVDAAVLRKFQGMTTREQEKFCQIHQKDDAKAEWDKLGFPKINWTNLDSRINKHHAFVRKLINGQDSHYRAELQAKVDEGKDRNLLKATANLTPGYYGGRGLRILSENIMNKHTDLIKKRAPKDTLMSARGVTGFVQSVLVPEVAVLLIKEDMKISIEEARDLLAESARMGELVHEEMREVLRRRVVDSDGDDDFDD